MRNELSFQPPGIWQNSTWCLLPALAILTLETSRNMFTSWQLLTIPWIHGRTGEVLHRVSLIHHNWPWFLGRENKQNDFISFSLSWAMTSLLVGPWGNCTKGPRHTQVELCSGMLLCFKKQLRCTLQMLMKGCERQATLQLLFPSTSTLFGFSSNRTQTKISVNVASQEHLHGTCQIIAFDDLL